MLLLAALAFVVALLVLPLDIWALPFRAKAGLRRSAVRVLDRFAAWAFPRR